MNEIQTVASWLSSWAWQTARATGLCEMIMITFRLCIPGVSWLYKLCVYVWHDALAWIFLHKEMCCIGHMSSLSNQLFPTFICFQRLLQWYALHMSQNLICSAELRLFTSGLSGWAFKERPSQGDVEKVKQIDKDKESSNKRIAGFIGSFLSKFILPK